MRVPAECRYAHVWEWPCKCVWRECVKAQVYVRVMTKSHVPCFAFFFFLMRLHFVFFSSFCFFTELFLLNTNAVLVAVLYIQSYPQKYTLVLTWNVLKTDINITHTHTHMQTHCLALHSHIFLPFLNLPSYSTPTYQIQTKTKRWKFHARFIHVWFNFLPV